MIVSLFVLSAVPALKLPGVPPTYDYSKSTSANYANPGARLRREFITSRAGLDYRFHVRYSLERQALQDSIIRSMLSFEDMQTGRPEAQPEWLRKAKGSSKLLRQPRQPWCVFTAGAMGAGKTHVMCALDRHGLLPLPRFVRVDLDRIRALLPETEGYSKRVAGAMTQREAGAIAEIVSEEALSRGLNVWIDSTLKDADWWSQELQRVKRSYPHRLCILHVTASWARVEARAERRAEATGRTVPPEVLREAFKQVPASVARLAPLVDECIEIDNDVSRQAHLKTATDVRALLRVCREVGGDCATRELEGWLPRVSSSVRPVRPPRGSAPLPAAAAPAPTAETRRRRAVQ